MAAGSTCGLTNPEKREVFCVFGRRSQEAVESGSLGSNFSDATDSELFNFTELQLPGL